MSAESLELISTLLQSGVGVLALYLYFQERQAHKLSRDEHLKDLKQQYDARIADHKFWLDFVGELITAGVGKPLFQPSQTSIPVKPQHIDKK